MTGCPEGLTPGFGVGNAASAICLIKSDFGIVDGTRRIRTGSGMLFRTENRASFVVTAGHNLYHHDIDRTARAVTLWFGRVGDVMMAQREGRAWCAAPNFVEATTPIASDDIGVIRVSELGGDRFDPIPIGDPDDLPIGTRLLVGYPDEDVCFGKFRPYNVRLETADLHNDNYAYADIPTYVGMSGGPLIARRTQMSPISSYGLHIRGPGQTMRGIRFSQRVRALITSLSAQCA